MEFNVEPIGRIILDYYGPMGLPKATVPELRGTKLILTSTIHGSTTLVIPLQFVTLRNSAG